MKVIEMDKNKPEKMWYLKIGLAFGYEYTVVNTYEKLKEIRRNILEKWEKYPDTLHYIKTSNDDIVIDVSKVIVLNLTEEDESL